MPSHRGFGTSPTMRGIKHDSSLNDGFERVTHSMTLDCHRKEMHRERILEKAEAPGFCSRQACTCVNMTNEHTIEFRIFRGTLKYDIRRRNVGENGIEYWDKIAILGVPGSF